MKNILHIIDSLGIGGAERLLVNVINNLVGFRHHVVSLSDKIDLAKEIDSKCRIIKLGFVSKLDTPRCVLTLRKYIKQNNIEIVHSHLVMSNIIARLATPSHVSLFNSLHSLSGERVFSSGKSWQRMVEKLTYSKRVHLVAVSQAVLNDYETHIGIKGPATVLHNFVEDRFFAILPQRRHNNNNSLRLVAVGALKPAKNYEFLIEAFSQLPENISLDIYGQGPLQEQLVKAINEKRVAVHLCGVRSDIEKVLPEYDLYVLSSLYEGHPIALLEAMAGGMPALVSDIPVLREATGNNGLFFRLDKIEDFVQQVKMIANGEIDIDQFAAYNLEFANKVARKEKYLNSLINLYEA